LLIRPATPADTPAIWAVIEPTVPAGETATTTFIFTEPGELIIGCHLPGHYAYGMRAVVRVG
jgi:uncharacterized cupredoxin-like copper-binding protein